MPKENFHFFWKSKLSQWSYSPFIDRFGIQYNCSEQYMMAEKARLFFDFEIEQRIMESENPKQQKALGRQVKNFNQEIWALHKERIVYEANVYKFSQNQEHYDQLMSTEGKTLVEASPYDRIWGIGLVADDPKAKNRVLWKGQNLLGKTLTRVREYFLRLKSGQMNE